MDVTIFHVAPDADRSSARYSVKPSHTTKTEPFLARKGAGLLHEGRGEAGVHGPLGPGAVCSVDPAADAEATSRAPPKAFICGSALVQFFVAPPVPSPMWKRAQTDPLTMIAGLWHQFVTATSAKA